MLSEIFGTVLPFFKESHDDDFVDHLNYYYTTTFVIASAALISFKTFGGKPVECWLPAQYSASWEDYSGMKCGCTLLMQILQTIEYCKPSCIAPHRI